MKNPKLSIRSRKAQKPDGFADHSSPLDSMGDTAAVYLDWSDGQILGFYSSDSESPSLVNLKKGIASLFQLQSSENTLEEVDASGHCKTSYKVINGRTLLKKKTGCQFQRAVSPTFSRSQKVACFFSSSRGVKHNLKELLTE